jgi:hypothetical protein
VLTVLLILSGLLAVPRVRAMVLSVLRLGAVQILLGEPTLTPSMPLIESPLTATPILSLEPDTPAVEGTIASLTITPLPTPTSLFLTPDTTIPLVGETTLAIAQGRAGFPILLPSYPSDLGTPDKVFYQEISGPVVVLVWLHPDNPDQIRLSLHILGPGVDALKGPPQAIAQTAVNGQLALWTEGPYMLLFRESGVEDLDARWLVKGHVLIWMIGENTYRLESDLSMEEAVRIAESLR